MKAKCQGKEKEKGKLHKYYKGQCMRDGSPMCSALVIQVEADGVQFWDEKYEGPGD